MTRAKKKPVSIGVRIGQARTAYRMSQSQLAAKLKVTRAAVSLYEKDRNRPRAEVIDRLAELFGAAPEWFTHGRGDEPRPADLPVTIPEIEVAQITPQVVNLAALATSRRWTLPDGVLDCQAPDHMIAFTAPNDAGPIGAGDRVVVDLQRRTGFGVFLVYEIGEARLYEDGHPGAVLGRVVAYFRAI